MNDHTSNKLRFMPVVLAIGLASLASVAAACPFCRPVKTTFGEDIAASDVTILAELVDRPQSPNAAEGEVLAADIIDSYKTTFRIVKIYKGAEHVEKGQSIVAIYTGDAEPGTLFLLQGVDAPALQWSPPVALTERGQQYVEAILKLPPDDGAQRLRFFEPYLEDAEELLRNDAFDEFARADYKTLKAIKDEIDRDRLVEWIKNPEVVATNRRLYFTMLGICGGPEDAQMLEDMIKSGDRKQMSGLDSLIACYLNLRGPDGMPLIEDRFLRAGLFWDPEYVHTYGAIMALRFHGQESDAIPRERLLAALRIMLDRPQLADLVIPDLARWEDWGSMERLVRMFKEADKDSSWVRVPIVNFLRACPLLEAKDHLAELSKLDPDTIRRASTFFPFAPGGKSKASDDGPDGDKSSDGQDPALADGGSSNDGQEAAAAAMAGDPAAAASAAAPNADEQSADAQTGTAGQRLAKGPSETTASDAEPPGVWTVLLPVGAAVALFCLMWLILRRPREPMTNQNA